MAGGDEQSGEARRRRRLEQLRQAQQDRRERTQQEGKVLLQGLVEADVKRRFRRLKGEWNMDSMGEVMTRLIEEWEVRNGG